MSDQLGRRLSLNAIRDGERIDLIAEDSERKSIAERLGLPALDRLEAHAVLSKDGEKIHARGRLKASLTQDCAITGEPIATHADEPFEILFVPQPDHGRSDEEIELNESDCDIVFHDGSSIALGEAIADTLALSLDPYPRSAGADAVLKEAGVLSEAEAGPFAELAKLKRGESGRS